MLRGRLVAHDPFPAFPVALELPYALLCGRLVADDAFRGRLVSKCHQEVGLFNFATMQKCPTLAE